MYFKNRDELLLFLYCLKQVKAVECIGTGSQGICFYDKIKGDVYKIFHQFFEDYGEDKVIYNEKELLRFSNIKNNTFLWPKDIIVVGDEIVGYVSDYFDGKNLYEINPLSININKFIDSISQVLLDIKKVSSMNIRTYDVMYNILYGKEGFCIIDHDEYCYSNMNKKELYEFNCDNFNIAIKYFLIDNYFDKFISCYKDLNEMYVSKGINVNQFLLLFRKYLNKEMGYNVIKLSEASRLVNKEKIKKVKYQRIIYDE